MSLFLSTLSSQGFLHSKLNVKVKVFLIVSEGNFLSIGIKMDATIAKHMVVNSLLRPMTLTVTVF